MASRVISWIGASAVLVSLIAASAEPAWAQSRDARPAPVVAPKQLKQLKSYGPASPSNMAGDDADADRTRNELTGLLQRYPPSVGRVLKLDPTLLGNADYLATYPSLAAFLAQHPEVARNTPYFLERIRVGNENSTPRSAAADMWREFMSWAGGLSVVTIIAVTLTWLIRTLVDYRRWSRLAQVQAEAHGKVLDRMTANEELLAYVQSPAGSRFLESAPIALDPGARRLGAPFSRILWSAQAGLVLLAAGGGLNYVGSHVIADPADGQPFYALGVLGVAVGLGFIVSAIVAYGLSHRLGLFRSDTRPEREA